MLNEGEEEWVDIEEELSQLPIRSVWKMPLSKGAKLIKRISTEPAGDPATLMSEKQVKLLYRISKLKQLMDEAVHTLVKEVNGQGILAYQEETEEESSTLQTEGETEIMYNLIINLISEEKLPKILKEIQEVIDRYPKVISKGE